MAPTGRSVAVLVSLLAGCVSEQLLEASAASGGSGGSAGATGVGGGGGTPCPSCGPSCGDGRVDPDAGESCDDGNDLEGDGCTFECRRACLHLTRVASGSSAAAAVDDAGRLWTWGENPHGQLGRGNEARTPPTLVLGITQVDALVAGDSSLLVHTPEGYQVAGRNFEGMLSLEEPEAVFQPTRAPRLAGFRFISLGNTTTLALDEAGGLHGLGGNGAPNGALLGAGEPGGPEPVLIDAGPFAAVEAEYYHGLALQQDGGVVSWGLNSFGVVSPALPFSATASDLVEIPLPAGTRATAIAAGPRLSMVLLDDARVLAWGLGHEELWALQETPDVFTPAPVVLPDGARAAKIAAGAFVGYVTDEAGKVYSFGFSEYGGLAREPPGPAPSAFSGPAQVQIGEPVLEVTPGFHTVFFRTETRVFVAGDTRNRMFGAPQGVDAIPVPVQFCIMLQ